MSGVLLFIPFAVQAALMGVDELHFHRRRGLQRWERIGHPLDTATVAGCYAFLGFSAPSSGNLTLYIILCALSSLFVTKDERVHALSCTWQEHWLHAVLFILHPLAFTGAGVYWLHHGPGMPLIGAAAAVALFGLAQAHYWSRPCPRPQ
jgi:hypothetical protein